MRAKSVETLNAVSIIVLVGGAIFWLLTSGCATTPPTNKDPTVIDRNISCRHSALLAGMLSVEEGYPTRICMGKTLPEYQKYPGKLVQFHLQARSEIGNTWWWLSLNNLGDFPTKSLEHDYWFTPPDNPNDCFTLDEYWEYWRLWWVK